MHFSLGCQGIWGTFFDLILYVYRFNVRPKKLVKMSVSISLLQIEGFIPSDDGNVFISSVSKERSEKTYSEKENILRNGSTF